MSSRLKKIFKVMEQVAQNHSDDVVSQAGTVAVYQVKSGTTTVCVIRGTSLGHVSVEVKGLDVNFINYDGDNDAIRAELELTTWCSEINRAKSIASIITYAVKKPK